METINKIDHRGWKIRDRFRSLAGSIVMVIVILNFYVPVDIRWFVEDEAEHKNSLESCDLFSGQWIYDNKSYPLYKEGDCTFMSDEYACEKFGRKEFKYQNWRWQPHGCRLPRFNGTALLEKLRDKRLVFVGDSLNRNQFTSLMCLVDSSIPDPSQKHSQWHGSLVTFRAYEYNASIDFYWEPLLVESNCDDPINHHIPNRILKIESIEKHARHWMNADYLVFDSFTWWLETNMTFLWGSFENPERTYHEPEMTKRFRRALDTWSDWLEVHVNRTKTTLIFMSLSPHHKEGKDWGKDAKDNCYNEIEPITKAEHWGSGSDIGIMRTLEEAVKDLKTRGLEVKILNITQLSNYRKDGHPSIYRRHWHPPTEMELKNPVMYADCMHWCLPGVPDVWNEILYAYITRYS